MDPLSVIRTLWRHRFLALPIVVLTVAGSAYIAFLAPRSFEASATYALVNPDVPSQADVEADPALGSLNSNNPYLRSADPSLIVQALMARLNSQIIAQRLQEEDLGTEYQVAPTSSFGSGLLLQVSAVAATPETALATVARLHDYLNDELRSMQKVNGADDVYLFTALEVTASGNAKEQVSSRLRAVISIVLAGGILLVGAVSVARSLDAARRSGRDVVVPVPETGAASGRHAGSDKKTERPGGKDSES